MANERSTFKIMFRLLSIVSSFLVCHARVHHLNIENDGRQEIDMSTFGFLKDGILAVNVSLFNVSYHKDQFMGLTIERALSSGLLMNGQNDRCSDKRGVPGKDRTKENSTIHFLFNLAHNNVSISKGEDMKKVQLCELGADMMKQFERREFSLESHNVWWKTEAADDENSTARSGSRFHCRPMGKVVSFNKSNNGVGVQFVMVIAGEDQAGLYNLFFHNCNNPREKQSSSISLVNFTIHIVERNGDNFLSAGKMALPTLFYSFSILYFLIGCYWFYVLRSSVEDVFRTHYLMLVLLFVKSLTLLFHGLNYHSIQMDGQHMSMFAILYYITHLMKGALLFVTIVLIGAGWAFIKHILSDRDKKIFIIVIPLQILANVAQIIIEETEEGESSYARWREIFILVDLLCCGAILFPVVWSIRHLQEASTTDGKAAICLLKLKMFRHFYIMIVCYIYFTRFIVYLIRVTVPFQFEWLDELFREMATLTFFVITGYKFRPASNNPYLQVSTSSGEEEMEEVVTKSGAYDKIVHVNAHASAEGASKRESSHDYD